MTKKSELSTAALWARFRFSVVGPLLSSPPARGDLKAALQALAAKTWTHPVNAREVYFSPVTIERWSLHFEDRCAVEHADAQARTLIERADGQTDFRPLSQVQRPSGLQHTVSVGRFDSDDHDYSFPRICKGNRSTSLSNMMRGGNPDDAHAPSLVPRALNLQLQRPVVLPSPAQRVG
jgi:hypothetical protein